ncbi:MAG TPA: exodeoxyribonuclease VII large subunit, partial [Alphaproteobacteria bacterium]|nr:exodeoxyribonuclease VII large subunit [Alphaproteobacteria bacterium]
QIASAIIGFNALKEGGKIPKPDVLIVARGGGSLEDLWAFNEEVVIRAVYESDIPVISAVGHETDTMLIDYVSDLRAPTPTGAAEFAVPVKTELEAQIKMLDARRITAFARYMRILKERIEGLKRGIPNLSQILADFRQRFDERVERLKSNMKMMLDLKKKDVLGIGLKPYYIQNLIEKKKVQVEHLQARLESVSIEQVLKRGFAWVTDRHFKTIYDATKAKRAGELNVRFVDGIVKTKVVEERDALQIDLFDNE